MGSAGEMHAARNGVANFGSRQRVFGEVGERPAFKRGDDGFVKLDHGAMVGAYQIQAIEILAEITEYFALTGFNNIEQRDFFGGTIQSHPTFHAAMSAKDAGPDKRGGNLGRITGRGVDMFGDTRGGYGVVGLADHKKYQRPEGGLRSLCQHVKPSHSPVKAYHTQKEACATT